VRPIAVVEPLLLGAVPNSEYWATIAQVLPVLGLAIVLEARTISQRWTPETPKWLRFTQSLIWVVPLVLLAIGESAALRALRGVQVWPWWTLLMEITISAAISVLFLAPALELLTKGYAEAAARIMTGGWLPRLRLALLEHREYRQHRKLHTLRAWLWQHLHWHEAVDRIIASGSPGFERWPKPVSHLRRRRQRKSCAKRSLGNSMRRWAMKMRGKCIARPSGLSLN